MGFSPRRLFERPRPKLTAPSPPLRPWSEVTIPAPAQACRPPDIAATWEAVHEAVSEYTALAPTREWRRAWVTLGTTLRQLERLERAREGRQRERDD